MALILWNTDDSFENLNAIWSGGQATSGTRLFMDPFNTYIGGAHTKNGQRYITRIVLSGGAISGVFNEEFDVSPSGITTAPRIEVASYMSEYGISLGVFAVVSSGGSSFFSPYPSASGLWTTTNPVSGYAVDVITPDYDFDPRFLIGISGPNSSHVRIVVASGNLNTRHTTNWSAMPSGSSVTDLEVVRLV